MIKSINDDLSPIVLIFNPDRISLTKTLRFKLAKGIPANVLMEERPLVKVGPLSIKVKGRKLLKELLFELGEGKCFCCGEPLNLSTKPSKPHSVTFEHILPRRSGGDSSLENLSLSHKSCNNKRA